VKAGNPGAADRFGESLALSSDATRIAVGSTGEDGAGLTNSTPPQNNSCANCGAAYVYLGTL
jgi:hypothetical protein